MPNRYTFSRQRSTMLLIRLKLLPSKAATILFREERPAALIQFETGVGGAAWLMPELLHAARHDISSSQSKPAFSKEVFQ